MNSRFTNTVSRRTFLQCGASVTLTTISGSRIAQADGPTEIRVRTAPGAVHLTGDKNATTDVLAYNGSIPGPTLRLKQGEPVRLIVENRMDQDTTVHWHGIRVPNAMDGVPGLTQPPIEPGQDFPYEFTPPDAGTFWYHPHANSLQQIGRGLAGALIVEEREPVTVDRDLLWVLQDWRFNKEGQIAKGFGSMMDAVMSGRVGNVVTINGAVPINQSVKAGERIRLRLANAALARMMSLRIEGHSPVIVAIDGQPCDPHEPEGGRLVLAPAMRLDVILDMQGEPGKRYEVIDDFYDRLAYTLTTLAYDAGSPVRVHPLDAPMALPRNPLPKPDLANAVRQEIVLQGGMMGGGKLKGLGGMMDNASPGMDGGPVWAINGMSMTGDGAAGMPSLFTLKRGSSCVLTIRNETAWWHPMHIHGFSPLVLTRNGAPVPNLQWQDTMLLAPRDSIECAFVADNPGDWMLHCHVTDHQMTGLMTVFRVT